MALIDSIIGAESGGDPNARNPNSSAMGAGQFISSTWLDTLKAARPDLAQGKSDDELLALRSDPQLSRQMTEAYAAQNAQVLANAGHPVTPGNTYLAHFAGPQGAVSVLNADPSAPVSSVLTPGAVKANPFLQGMTVADLRSWADRKMGGAQFAQTNTIPSAPTFSPAQEAAAPNGFRTMNIGGYDMPQFGTSRDYAPRSTPPIFAQPQAGPQQQQQAAPPAPPQFEPPPAGPPIFFAPRHQPDLSKLRATFHPPIFGRRT